MKGDHFSMSKRTTRIICLILAVLMVFGVVSYIIGSTALAVTQSEIDALQAQRDEIRSQQKDIQEQIDSLRTEKTTALSQKSMLDRRNGLNEQDIALITEQIDLYDSMIAEKGEELETAIAEEEAQYSRYQARVRSMEENSTISQIFMIFPHFNCLFSRMRISNNNSCLIIFFCINIIIFRIVCCQINLIY